MITDLFILTLNMSITAGYAAAAVIITRFVLRRSPKIFSYFLWSAVMFRLLLPFSFTSSFSFLRWVQPEDKAGTGVLAFVPQDIGMQLRPAVDAGISGISRLVNTSLPDADRAASINPLQVMLWIGSLIWLAGVAMILVYSIVSYQRLMSRVRTATLVRGNIFESEQIGTPFVCGFLKPRIYIPSGMDGQEHILLHEETHIRRRDYLIKPFAFVLLAIHWFNPLMWLSYVLMSKDMEMSCDEAVVKKLGSGIKGSYSNSLLSFAVRGNGVWNGSPLAFGESDVKARIKNVLAYRQPSRRMVTGLVLVIAVIIAGCTANPKLVGPTPAPAYSGYDLKQLMQNSTLYVGNASKVGGLLRGMPVPEGLESTGMELQTADPPYGLTVNYDVHDSAALMKNEAISGDAFYPNAILLFSLIDNVDHVTISLADHTGLYDGASYSFTYYREQAEKLMDEDVRLYAEDEAGLRRLIDKINGMTSYYHYN
ncbi:M56 family metallopeptidase [Paenibacillus tengchongensis]|uniref:M56 family metallopeptidase n=1 Tax=Paenibacillus tengchongensis TaxID=2608684 RepID=UPI001FEA9231|nr:M56 family metallopeptidase [Paenibacillus tengchongensis]